MHPLSLPDDTLLVPVQLPEPVHGVGLVARGPDHPDYGTWLALAEPVAVPPSTPLLDPNKHPLAPEIPHL